MAEYQTKSKGTPVVKLLINTNCLSNPNQAGVFGQSTGLGEHSDTLNNKTTVPEFCL